MSLFGDIAEAVLKGAVKKACDGFVKKGEITAAQEPELVEGIMLELQIALDMYEQSQAKAAPT